jgi:imidazolonepropionase-like amidohydrolase
MAELLPLPDQGEPSMRALRTISPIFAILGICASFASAQNSLPSRPIVIAASAAFDGKGNVLRDVHIKVANEKIVAISPSSSEPVDYDLRGLTVLPGWIDAHAHITWSFGPDGKNAGMAGTTQADAYRSASNAWLTLIAGFTTIQSPGSPNDIPLRDAIAKGILPGPRILTAAEPLVGKRDATGTPEEIRAFIRKQKEAGADVIKIFASKSIRQGGGMTLSQEQLNAACDEAHKQGLRTMVHAYKDAVRAATLAGCTQIEHGTLASDEDLKLMVEKGTYFDPQCGLVIENYMLNKSRYIGTEGYTEEGFTAMENILSADHEIVQHAAKTPGLKMVFGTDAVAGSHGRNAEEFVDRVRDCGVEPMAAMVSANALAAEAMGLADQIGTLAVGMQADIIALDGDPVQDITAVRRVVFVMKGGLVYKNVAKKMIPLYAGVQP